MPTSQFAVITCEIEYTPESGELPDDDAVLKPCISAVVGRALARHPELTVYGRVKVDLT